MGSREKLSRVQVEESGLDESRGGRVSLPRGYCSVTTTVVLVVVVSAVAAAVVGLAVGFGRRLGSAEGAPTTGSAVKGLWLTIMTSRICAY